MTLIRPIFLAALMAAAAPALWALEKDEVGYQAKTYAPRKSLSDSSYAPKKYTPASATRSIGTPAEQPKTSGSRWSFFTREKPMPAPEESRDRELEHAEAYVQRTHTVVPTIKADTRDIPDKKMFDETGKRVDEAPYTPNDKPQPKNPLLVPRQGIKAPAAQPE